MKKFALICSMLIYACCLWGAPTLTATRGLDKVIDATPERLGRLNFILGLGAYRGTLGLPAKDSIYDSDGNLHSTGNIDLCWLGDLNMGLGFAATDFLSVNLSTKFLVDFLYLEKGPEGADAAAYGFSDVSLGVKFCPTAMIRKANPNFLKFLDIGVYPMFSFATGQKYEPLPDTAGTDNIIGKKGRRGSGGIHRFFSLEDMMKGAKGLVTLTLPMHPVMKIHLNGGYLIYPHPDICNKLTYGVGLELIYHRFAPFVEFYGEKRANKDYNDGGQFITPGLRFETGKDSYITLSMDFRLSGADTGKFDPDLRIAQGIGTTPPWKLNISASGGFDFVKPPAKKGIIAGKVVEIETQKGVESQVSFPEFDTLVTTDEHGNYRMELPVGKTTVYVYPSLEKEYETPPSKNVTIVSGETIFINFEVVRKEIPVSILTGKITDKSTGAPCFAAIISLPETEFPEIKSDADGIYKIELPPGTYVVKVQKEGYTPWTQPVVCRAEETIVLNIELTPIEEPIPEPVKEKAIIAGKVIDYSTRKGLAAVIKFQETEIPSAKTDPEIGTYKIEVPAGTYTLRIEAEGYLPEGAVIVCKPGSSLVKDFELFKKEEKIVLDGINFGRNKANIKPESYPILDRAVLLLKEHPSIRVIVAGHTDSEGSKEYNQQLSQRRAESVRFYLIEHGIVADRLIPKGFGETQPIASNKNLEGRAKNRRIEFQILSE